MKAVLCRNRNSFVLSGIGGTRLLFLLLITSLSIHGNELAHWIGANDGTWSNAANWDIPQPPNNTATVRWNVVWDSPPVTLNVDIPVLVSNFTSNRGGTL